MSTPGLSLPPLAKGLSARLLVLTIAFVMLSEVFIYTPSIGRYRKVYLEERIAAAHIATLALKATPDEMVSAELELELLSHAGAYVVELYRPGAPGELMLGPMVPPRIDAEFDLRKGSFFGFIDEAFTTMLQDRNRIILVRGNSPKEPETLVEIWQANAAGRYRHAQDLHDAPLDPNFSGAGRVLTGADGRFRFVTVKPGAYPWQNHDNAWRPAHVHFSVYGRSFLTRLVTQMYFPGDPLLELDPIFNSVPSERARTRLVSTFDLALTEPVWALGYRFDIVLRGRDSTPTGL